MKKMTEVEALKVKKDGLENPHFPGMEEMEREREGFLIHMEEMEREREGFLIHIRMNSCYTSASDVRRW